jgi:toxin CcdB
MAQFDVYRNRNAASRSRFPYLLDVQADILESLATRVVVPLAPAASARAKAVDVLMPRVKVDGKEFIAVVPQLAGISAAELGPRVTSVASDRAAFIAALDLLVTGI